MIPFPSHQRLELLNRLDQNFDLEEFRELCFLLAVDSENLKGETKRAKMQVLIEEWHKTAQLDVLVAAIQEARPQQDWTFGPPSDLPSPYKGLFAFREGDAVNFFGRASVTNMLVEAISHQRFIALIGPSGSGKSSVVFAGLVPRLRYQGHWLILSFRPGAHPFRALAATLIPWLEGELSETVQLIEIRRLAQALTQGELSLAEVLVRILEKNPSYHQVILIIDQFEELYTLCPEMNVRHRFIDQLLSKSPERDHKLLLTLRADFMGQALGYRPFADMLQKGDVKLGPMNRTELQEAIEQPVTRAGVRFEAGLTERILDDVGDEPGSLPLLQFALSLLWEQQSGHWITHAAYDAIRGVSGALTQYADERYARLTAAEQEQVRRVFIQLVSPGAGTEDTRRTAGRNELGAIDWHLVQELANERLVVTGQDLTGQETVEVAHEALIGRWQRLQDWMAEDRSFRAWQERLRIGMRQWQESGQDEGVFLRGSPLAEAEGWLAERPTDLSQTEKQFIQTSIELREREATEREARRQYELETAQKIATLERQRTAEQAKANRQLRRGTRLLLGALMVVFISAIAIFFLARNAQQQTRRVTAQALAARSAEIVERDPHLALLMAYQSIQETLEIDGFGTTEAKSALFHALNAPLQQSSISVADSFSSAQFNHDGSRIITLVDSFQNHAAYLWDGQGAPINVFLQATQAIFDPSGIFLLTSSLAAETTQIRDLNGHSVKTLSGHSAVFSSDGSRFLTKNSRGQVWLWQSDGELITSWVAHSGSINTINFSQDGQYILTQSIQEGLIHLWDDTGNLITTIPQAGLVTINQTGTRIITWSFDVNTSQYTFQIWNNSGEKLREITHPTIPRIIFHPSGTQFVTSGEEIQIWDQDGNLLKTLEGHTGWAWAVAYNASGSILVTVSNDATARLWDENGNIITVLEGHLDTVNSAIFDVSGEHIVTTSADRTARLWDTKGNLIAVLDGHRDSVLQAVYNQTGTRLLTASRDGVVRIWDRDGTPIASLDEHRDKTYCAVFSDDDTLILSAGRDGTARLWDENGIPLAVLQGHEDDVWSVAFSPAGNQLLTASFDRTARLWDLEGNQLAILSGHTGELGTASFSHDGSRILTPSSDGTVRLWNNSGHLLHILSEHVGKVWWAAFSHDDSRIVTVGVDGIGRLWDAEGNLLTLFEGHEGDIWFADFSPDDTKLVTAGDDGTARIWDLEGNVLAVLVGHEGGVNSAVFNRAGTQIVTSGADNIVRLWDIEGKLLATMSGHTGPVRWAEFNPQDTQIVSGSSDGTVRLWEAKGEPLAALAGHTNTVRTVFFNSDGTKIVSASDDGTVRLWHTYPTLELMLLEAERRIPLMTTPETCVQYLDAAACHLQ